MTYKKSYATFLCLLTSFSLSYTKESSKILSTEKAKPKGITMLKSNENLNLSEFTKSPSGLLYKITKKGTGSKPYAGETVTVHYTGHLLNGDHVGAKFDSSKDRGQHFKFVLGQGMVIKGWDLSLADMQIGETRVVILPPSLAYGSHGAGAVIPPNATLIFEIELFDAK